MARRQDDPRRETDTLRGLARGLQVLEYLNVQDGAAVADIARGTRLPRTTVIRILETLRRAGYLRRGTDERGYRLSIRVRELADGYDDETWVTDVAHPYLRRLGEQLVWPVLLATPLGSSMLWRVNTDHLSPVAVKRYTVGFRTPLLESASGHAFLAFCTADQRSTALELVATLRQFGRHADLDRRRITRELARVRARGCAIVTRPLGRETALSVPVLAAGRYLASLTVRYPRGAFADAEATRRFAPPLAATAAAIGHEFVRLAGERWREGTRARGS